MAPKRYRTRDITAESHCPVGESALEVTFTAQDKRCVFGYAPTHKATAVFFRGKRIFYRQYLHAGWKLGVTYEGGHISLFATQPKRDGDEPDFVQEFEASPRFVIRSRNRFFTLKLNKVWPEYPVPWPLYSPREKAATRALLLITRDRESPYWLPPELLFELLQRAMLQ